MRDIIFRGKAIGGLNACRWIYGYYVKDFWTPSSVGHGIIPADRDIGGYCAVYPDTVGQYTGIKDKNGKMIFEGDIVRYIAQKSGRTILYGVEWQEEMSRFEMKTINDGMKLHEWLERSKANYCYEVIGNIHDNPELLKEGDSDA